LIHTYAFPSKKLI